jgi:hypothetical protein
MNEERKDLSERELDSLSEEASKHGAVLAALHFDAQGKDEQAVRDALVDLVSRLSKENGVLYCKGAIEETIKLDDGMYSSYVEVKVLVENFSHLLAISLRFGPVSAEILKPSRISLELEDAHALLLEASQTAQDYARYMLERVMSPEEKAKFQARMKARAEMGKKLKEGR